MRPDGFFMFEDLGWRQSMLISPDQWRTFLKPAVAQLGQFLREEGIDFWVHSDGAVIPVIPDLIDCGVRVLNRAAALLAAHDKLRTARILGTAGIPHPRTALHGSEEAAALEPPPVVKPRFGSWGRDVFLCRDRNEVQRTIEAVAERPWFLRHGALLQEYVEAPRHDLRVVVANGAVAGAATRVAAPGEWRTNVSIGGRLEPVVPPQDAMALAVEAALAIGADFMGVDLIPDSADGFIVLELNGAAEFESSYSIAGRDVFRQIAVLLGLLEEPVRISA
jgi:RimK family alpha-L-glutamate ligase